jgi:hypothetical protein
MMPKYYPVLQSWTIFWEQILLTLFTSACLENFSDDVLWKQCQVQSMMGEESFFYCAWILLIDEFQ